MAAGGSIKARYRMRLQAFVALISLIIFAAFSGSDVVEAVQARQWSDLVDLKHVLSLALPLATLILDGFVSPDFKAVLVYWKWKNVLPAHEAYTVHAEKDSRVDWLGLIRTIRVRTQKSDGRPFAILTCEDMEGSLELTLFADAYAKHRALIEQGAVIWITGSVNVWNDKISLRVRNVKTLGEVRRRRIQHIVIEIPAAEISESVLTELRDILNRHRGRRKVSILIRGPRDKVTVELFNGYGVSPGDGLIQDLQDAHFEKQLMFLTQRE